MSAGHRTSHVIIKGDKYCNDKLYEHKIGERTINGIVHFYRNKEG